MIELLTQLERDNEILSKIALKDSSVFDQLYRSQYRKLFLLSFKYTRNHQVAEEVVHDVFIKIWNRSSALNITQSLNAYLARATVNKSLNVLKKEGRQRKHEEEFDTGQFIAAIAEGVSEEAENAELRLILLEQAIAKLPNQCRNILLMSKFQKLKQQQIADELNISIKTVKNHLTYAYKKLKDGLGLKLLLIALVFFYIGLLGFKFV